MSVENLLSKHEGLRLQVYDDATGEIIGPGVVVKGNPTIGYGRNLLGNGLTRAEAEFLLRNDINRVTLELIKSARAPQFVALSTVRTAVIIDMAVNMGTKGCLGFVKMWDAIGDRKWETAAKEMLDSVWAAQVGDRAKELSEMMRTGRWAKCV